jgi:hypothetical protein
LADAAAARSTAALLGQVGATTVATIIVISTILTIILVTFTPQLDEALTELLLARGDGSSVYQQQQLRGRAAADESNGNAERVDVHKSHSLGTAAGESDDDDIVIELNRCNPPSSSSVLICALPPSSSSLFLAETTSSCL